MLLRTASFSVGLHVVRAPFDPLRPPDGFRTSSPNNKPFLFLAHVYVCFDTAQVVCGKLWGWGTLLGTTVHSLRNVFFSFQDKMATAAISNKKGRSFLGAISVRGGGATPCWRGLPVMITTTADFFLPSLRSTSAGGWELKIARNEHV